MEEFTKFQSLEPLLGTIAGPGPYELEVKPTDVLVLSIPGSERWTKDYADRVKEQFQSVTHLVVIVPDSTTITVLRAKETA